MRDDDRGERYEAAYERRAAAGEDVHGEANFVMLRSPGSVLDAGCGTGRVGRELFRRGVAVVGVDVDAEMLETARRRCPKVAWLRADISTLALGREFDLVLMAGNVINFCPPDRRREAIVHLARHVRPGGALVSGHSLVPGGCTVGQFDAWSREAGGRLLERWASWDSAPFGPDSDYCLSVVTFGP